MVPQRADRAKNLVHWQLLWVVVSMPMLRIPTVFPGPYRYTPTTARRRGTVRTYEISPTQFRVADFLGWQRGGTLDLNPPFQRRSIWKNDARSYFIDTVARGLPVPLVFLRERVDLKTQHVVREVVDGQQRLRTVFAFIDSTSMDDVTAADSFTVSRAHNSELAGRAFNELDDVVQARILGYKFAVDILPPEMEDREVLQIFARLNSTGLKLNPQELRNAAYFGEFKTLAYQLGYEQFERWLAWRLFSPDQLSRMQEVELVSDLLMNMMEGLLGKSQAAMNKFYARYDGDLADAPELARRFRRVMDLVEEMFGPALGTTAYSSQIHFFTLFVFLYDRLYGLGAALEKTRAKTLPPTVKKRLEVASRRFKDWDLPEEVIDAVARAATDIGRRRTRLRFIAAVVDGEA
jgi:hypothetical protein